MRRASAMTVGLAFLLLCPAARAERRLTPAERAYERAATAACAERAPGAVCQLLQLTREELRSKVVHYKALLKVGPGEHDVIAVHRLVRETKGTPVRTAGSLFFVPGSAANFYQEAMVPFHGRGFGVFLAQRAIDVWGIDLRHVQIPGEVTDLSFARDWGLGVQVQDTMVATRFARHVRAFSRQGSAGIILSGHSAGAAVVYAVANAEAVLEAPQRDVVGIVPMDMIYKLPPDATEQQQFSCNVSASYRGADAAGFYLFDNRTPIAASTLALADPDGVSPYAPPLTNVQFMMEAAAAPGFLPAYPFHRWAVVRDESGVAVAGRYSATEDILRFTASSAVYQIPNATIADFFDTSCPTIDSPYDGNLGLVEIPVLYVGVAGGFGEIAEYTLQFVASTDVTTILMKAAAGDDPVDDFGHMEPFTAAEARHLVWRPLHAWIVTHSNRGQGR